MTELARLRNSVATMNYPMGIMEMKNGEISGQGFFPGADGTTNNTSTISTKPIMIIGQDQDNESGFQESEGKKNECYTPTWQNMKKLLKDADMNINDCFFTNAIMGIRVGENKNTGKSPAFKFPPFITECLTFLKYQIEIQQPKIIICLGKFPISLIGKIAPSLAFKYNGFEEIDKQGRAINYKVKIAGLANFETTVVYLLHPSFRNSNLKLRSYQHLIGNDAEIALLKAAVQHI